MIIQEDVGNFGSGVYKKVKAIICASLNFNSDTRLSDTQVFYICSIELLAIVCQSGILFLCNQLRDYSKHIIDFCQNTTSFINSTPLYTTCSIGVVSLTRCLVYISARVHIRGKLTYRIEEGNAVFFEQRYGNIFPPCCWVTGASEEHLATTA